MNVKLNKLIAQLPEVDFIDVFPSCGDESNIFGAGFYIYNRKFNKKVNLLSNYTLGTTPSSDLQQVIEKNKDKIDVKRSQNINKDIAELLSKNNIVAVFWKNGIWSQSIRK